MDVAILYSGGKDSTFAIQHAMKKGWSIKYLISIKPTRKDCYLFHYATVEHTKELAKIINLPHFYVKCNVANPKKEANIVKSIIEKNQKNKSTKIDALVLGGIGLQETQIGSLQKALLPMHIEVFASHAGDDHDELMEQMLAQGYEILITQIASDGLNRWIGRNITKDNFEQFKSDSLRYGFHVGGEGGYYDTLVTDAPFFSKKLLADEIKIFMEDDFCGHVEISKYKIINKKKLEIRQ